MRKIVMSTPQKKLFILFSMLFSMLVFSECLWGATYYVSFNSGDDSNPGTLSQPWKTLTKVNSANLQLGDKVLFNRGEVWRGQLLPQSGDEADKITYGAYGSGEKPRLMGSYEKNNTSDWSDTGERANVWATPDVSVTGNELISNPSFDVNMDGWWGSGSGTYAYYNRDTVVYDSSPAGCKVECIDPGSFPANITLITTQSFSITQDKFYVLTFRAKASSELNIPAIFLQKNGSPWTWYFSVSSERNPTITTDWATYKIAYKANITASDARISILLGGGGGMTAGQILYVDTFSLKEASDDDLFYTDVGNIIFNSDDHCGVKRWSSELRNYFTYWPMDEGYGMTTADATEGGFGMNIDSGVSWITSGKYGNAISFDGSGSLYRSTPLVDGLAGPKPIDKKLTVEAWIKRDGSSVIMPIVVWGGLFNQGYRLYLEGGKVHFWVGGVDIETGLGVITDGEWHHVAGVWDSYGDSKLKIYVDGVERASGGSDITFQSPGADTNMYDLVLGDDATVETDDPAWTAGKYGDGLDFTESDADQLTLQTGWQSPNPTTGKLTVEAWIKPDSLAEFGRVIISNGWWGVDGYTLGAPSKIQFTVGDKVFESDYYAITAGVWQHVAAVWDGADDTVKLYRDGSVVSGGSFTSVGVNYADGGGGYIGRRSNGNYFDGIIDEVAIWDDALTQGQIEETMLEGGIGSVASQAEAMAYWALDEGSGQTTKNERADASFYIGKNSGSNYFQGTIDDVAVWGAALEAEDIQTTMTNGGKWQFAQGAFWYDPDNWVVKMYSDSNPATKYSDIECALAEPIIDVYGDSYIIFENLHLSHSGDFGILCRNESHDIIIRDCDISYIGGHAVYNEYKYIEGGGGFWTRGGNGVQLWGNAHDVTIERCRIWEVFDAAIGHEGMGADQYNFYFENNIIRNCEYSYAFYNDSGTPGEGISQNIYFENNTCINAGYGWGHNQRLWQNGRHVVFYHQNATTTDFYIRNNIFYGATEGGMWISAVWNDIENLVIDYNSWYPDVEDSKYVYYLGNYYSFSGYQSFSGKDANSIVTDPLFVDEVNLNFELQEDSLAIDAGIVNEILSDFKGVARPKGPGYDIGAYESVFHGDEVIIDFGPTYGIEVYYNNTTWSQLDSRDPDSIVTGDMDGDGQDELIVDFGGNGIQVMYNNIPTWSQLDSRDPDSIVTGDMDGNGQDELIVDFGGNGIQIMYNNSLTWTQLTPKDPESMVTGDMDGNGLDEVILDLGSTYGIWVRYNDTTWTQLTPGSPESMAIGDMDGNGQDDLLIDCGEVHGIHVMYNNSLTWTQLTPKDPESMVTGDMDGNGLDEVILDLGSTYGIWVRYNDTTWGQLDTRNPDFMVTGDMDGNGLDEVISDFGLTYGIEVYYNNALPWIQLDSRSAESMVTGDIDGTQ